MNLMATLNIEEFGTGMILLVIWIKLTTGFNAANSSNLVPCRNELPISVINFIRCNNSIAFNSASNVNFHIHGQSLPSIYNDNSSPLITAHCIGEQNLVNFIHIHYWIKHKSWRHAMSHSAQPNAAIDFHPPHCYTWIPSKLHDKL